MATLKNRSRTAQIYNLPHKTYCDGGECRCVDVTQHHASHDKDLGVMVAEEKKRPLAASIMFMAGETKADLPESIKNCPDIKGAIERRELVVIEESKE